MTSLARPTMVRNAFRALTDDLIPTRLLVVSDDMDGFRKIPDNVPNHEMLLEDRDKPVTSVRDPFGEYILPVAIIRLRQGFGRLIRSASDRGAVVLCDPRLRTRQYGVGFLRALPPAPTVMTALERVPALVGDFVNSGTLPETVGESPQWSSNDLEPA